MITTITNTNDLEQVSGGRSFSFSRSRVSSSRVANSTSGADRLAAFRQRSAARREASRARLAASSGQESSRAPTSVNSDIQISSLVVRSE